MAVCATNCTLNSVLSLFLSLYVLWGAQKRSDYQALSSNCLTPLLCSALLCSGGMIACHVAKLEGADFLVCDRTFASLDAVAARLLGQVCACVCVVCVVYVCVCMWFIAQYCCSIVLSNIDSGAYRVPSIPYEDRTRTYPCE